MADAREHFADHEEVLRVLTDAVKANIWTNMPGIIHSFDADAVTAQVQPSIQARKQAMDGTYSNVDIPLIPDVPVVFPHGGPFEITFPIAIGDECVLWISSRCIDNWWQSGGVQPPAHPRMHNLSDAFCMVGPRSQKTKTSPVNTAAVEMKYNGSPVLSFDGTTFVFTGNIMVTGGIITTMDVVANGVSLETHLTSGVQPGGGESGPPVPGT